MRKWEIIVDTGDDFIVEGKDVAAAILNFRENDGKKIYVDRIIEVAEIDGENETENEEE